MRYLSDSLIKQALLGSCGEELKYTTFRERMQQSMSIITFLWIELKIGNHTYTSNWTFANSSYDVLLGMLIHVSNDSVIDYAKWINLIKDTVISVD